MEKVSSSERFKTLMDERNLRQVDILNLVLPYCKKYNVKMNKSDISQYVSGKTEPSQEKLVVLGMALNVCPWKLPDIHRYVYDCIEIIRNIKDIVFSV
jgi:hypothetical protein